MESTTPPYEPTDIWIPPIEKKNISIQPSSSIHHKSNQNTIRTYKKTCIQNFKTNHQNNVQSHHSNPKDLKIINQIDQFNINHSNFHHTKNDQHNDSIEHGIDIYSEALQYLSENNFEVIRQVIEESKASCRLSIVANCLKFLAIGTEVQVSLAMVLLSIKLQNFFC